MCYRNPYVQQFRLLVNDPKAQKEYLQQNKTDLSIDLSNIINPLKTPTKTRSASFCNDNECPLKSSSPIKVNQGTPLLSTSFDRDLTKDDTNATMNLIEGFNDKMRSLEDMVGSFRRRVDQKNNASSERRERDEQMVWMFVREMNEKFRSLENMFKEMGNMNGKLVDALINNNKNKDMRDHLDASKYELQMLQERLKAAAEEIEKLKWQATQWFNYNQKLEAELKEERRKNAAIIQEYEILGKENENILAGIKQESAWRAQNGSQSFDVYKENATLRDRVEILVTQVRELEKNNARLTQETQGLAKDRMRLSERLRSRSGSLERSGSPNDSIRDQRVPTVEYMRNSVRGGGNQGMMNNSRQDVQSGGLRAPDNNRDRIMSFGGDQDQVKRGGNNYNNGYNNSPQMRNSQSNNNMMRSTSPMTMNGSGTRGNIRQFNASMMIQPTYNTNINVPPLDTQVVVNHMMNNHNVSYPLLNSQGIKVYNPNGVIDMNNPMLNSSQNMQNMGNMGNSQGQMMSNSGKSMRPKRQRNQTMSLMNNDQYLQMNTSSRYINTDYNPFNSPPRMTTDTSFRSQNSPNPLLNQHNNGGNQIINLMPVEGRQSPDISIDNGSYTGQPVIDVGRMSLNASRGNTRQNSPMGNSVYTYNLRQRS